MRHNPIIPAIILILSMPIFRASAAEWETFYPVRGFEDVAFRDGELWCGTGSGLFILDTEDFSYRRVTSMEGYPGGGMDIITQLAWEDNETLLVATGQTEDVQMGKGIYRYRPVTGDWSLINSDKMPPFVRSMAVYGESTAWLCGGGLHYVRNDSLITMTVENGLPSSVVGVTYITRDSAGNIWMGYIQGEIGARSSVIAKRVDGHWETVLEYPATSINNMTVARNGTVWFTLSQVDSLFGYDGITLAAYEFINTNLDPAERIAVTSDNEVWFTNSNQLIRIHNGVEEDMAAGFLDGLEAAGGPYPFSLFKNVYSNGNSIWVIANCGISASTYSLHYDTIGRYTNGEWTYFIPGQQLIYPYYRFTPTILGIGGDGAVWMEGYTFFSVLPVLSFDGESWENHDIEPFYSADHIFADTRNRTWLIGRGPIYEEHSNLIGYLENGVITVFSPEEYSLFLDSMIDGTATSSAVWAADASGNVYRYEYGGEWIRYDAADIGVPGIRCIAADNSGRIWVAGEHAIGWFDGSGWTVDTGFPANLVRDVAVDQHGVAWFATYSGLYSFDNGTWKTYTTQNSGLSSDDINHVLAARNGSLWISSYGGGLCRYDGNTWEVFLSGSDPLPSNFVFDIAEAPDGSIWIAANGLAHYTPDDLPTLAESGSGPRPAAIAITAAWPNPFNSMVTIGYELSDTEPVTLEIFNLAGQRIYHHDLGRMPAGIHQTEWQGLADNGDRVSTGIYILRLTSSLSIASVKTMYLK